MKEHSFGLTIVALSIWLLGCGPPPLMSYSYFWDHPQESRRAQMSSVLTNPIKSDFRKSCRAQLEKKDPSVKLNGDGTTILKTVPVFGGFADKGACRRTGGANWALDSELSPGWGWSVVFREFRSNLKAVQQECYRERASWEMQLLGRHAPYRLYTIVGDPDSDEGVEFKKVAP
jgi:hypothetical protein